jgi:hypothetical protein
MQRADLTNHQAHEACLDQFAHLFDRVRGGAEIVAPMQQGQTLGHRLQAERPVERAIAATDDEDLLVLHRLHATHRIDHRLALEGFDTFQRRTLGRERAAAGGDHHHLAYELGARVRLQTEASIGQLLKLVEALAEV